MKKRVISMLLVLVMALGLGAPVIADEGSGTVEEALTGAEELVDQGEGTPAPAVSEEPADGAEETTAPAVSEQPADEGEETPAPAASEEPADEGEETPAPVVPEEPADEGEPTPIEADGVAPIADTPAPAEQGEKVILHLAGETSAITESYIAGDGRIIPVEDGTELDPGVEVYVDLRGEYQLSVDSGTVEYAGYYCQSKTGELHRIYSLFAPQSGTMTITVSKSEEELPKVIPVQYAGETGRVVSLDSVKYALAGDYLMVAVSKGFTVTAVKGGSVVDTYEDENIVYHDILVDGNAAVVKVTVGAAKQIKVNITGNGQVKRMDGTVVQPGETVYENTELRLPDRTLYTVTVSDNVRWNNRWDDAGEYRTIVVTDSDGDGEITITITEAAMVTFHVQGEKDKAVFKDQSGNVLSDGSRFSEYVDRLNVELQPGYTVVGDCYLITDGGKTIGIGIDDPDKDGIITVTVTKMVTVHFDADAPGLKKVYIGEIDLPEIQDGAYVEPWELVYVELEAGYQASVDNGELSWSDYSCDPQTGELTNTYYFRAPESGTMTITVSSSSEESPKAIPVTYEGATEQISEVPEKTEYVLPTDGGFFVYLHEGYTVTAVQGGELNSISSYRETRIFGHYIKLSENVESVTVTIGDPKPFTVNIVGDAQVQRADGTAFQSGDTVQWGEELKVLDADRYIVPETREYEVQVDYTKNCVNVKLLFDRDCDGEVTLTITEASLVTFHVQGAVDKAQFSVNGKAVEDGSQFSEYIDKLDVVLQPGYTVAGDCYPITDKGKTIGISIDDPDKDGIITVTVVETPVTVVMEGETEGVFRSLYIYDGIETGTDFGNGSAVPAGSTLYLNAAPGYKMEFENAEVIGSAYWWMSTGEFGRTYIATAPASGTVTITTVKMAEGEETCRMVPVEYDDPDGKVHPDDKQYSLYFFYAPELDESSTPNFFSVAEGYELSVTGGTATRASDQSWAPEGYVEYYVTVDASAEKVVVSVRAKTPATPEPTDTPEPEPEVTPEPSPEMTPTPVPSPEVTPEPSPEPTPEPVTPDAPASGDGWSQNGNGDWFFFEDGQSVTGRWVLDGGQWYYPDTTGKVLVGLQTIEGDGTYYFNPVHDGTYGAALSGWREVNGSWYYFNEKHDGTYGKMATGWIYQGGDWYYTDRTTGAMDTGWLDVGGQTFYMEPTGKDAGVLQSGWQKVEDKWYYFNEKHDGSFGAMERDSWVHSAASGLWYYVDQDGVMLTGLQEIDGELYYLNPEDGATVGAVLAGWHEIDGVWYHFNEKHNGSYGACTWHG